jgi:hypothetical protein
MAKDRPSKKRKSIDSDAGITAQVEPSAKKGFLLAAASYVDSSLDDIFQRTFVRSDG